jgi:hypothetical protein
VRIVKLIPMGLVLFVGLAMSGCGNEDEIVVPTLRGLCGSCASSSDCEPGLSCRTFIVPGSGTRNLCARASTTTCTVGS